MLHCLQLVSDAHVRGSFESGDLREAPLRPSLRSMRGAEAPPPRPTASAQGLTIQNVPSSF